MAPAQSPLGSLCFILPEEEPDTCIFVLSRHAHRDGMHPSAAAPTPGKAGSGPGPVTKAAMSLSFPFIRLWVLFDLYFFSRCGGPSLTTVVDIALYK